MKRTAVKVCTVVLSVAGLVGCDWFRGTQNPGTPVQTIHPKRGEIVRRITLPGNVLAYQAATLYAKVAGYLKSINVDKGDSVKEGDLLAEIEAPEMLADLLKAKAEAEAAQLDSERVLEARHHKTLGRSRGPHPGGNIQQRAQKRSGGNADGLHHSAH